MRPILDRVIIEREVEDQIGGIIIPEAAQQKLNIGIVTETGEGLATSNGIVPLTVKKGDRVVFNPSAGIKVNVDGKDMLVMTEKEILAVI